MQRRDMGNEVIVALAAIGMLALALTFGIVLTLSRTVNNNNGTATAVAILPSTANATVNSTENATSAATSSVTSAATAGATAASTATAIKAATVTKPATAAPTQAATRAATTTATATITSTKTNTPTVTDTPTPSDTPTATFTLVPLLPAVTSGPPVPSDPPPTGILPTKASVVTAVPLPPLPGTTVALVTPGGTPCTLRSGWVVYTVQQGDTLFSISRQAGVTLAELQQANCILNPATIYQGQLLLIPPGKIILTITPAVITGTVVTDSGNAGVCPNAAARITSPIDGSAQSGIVTITGTANIPNFSYFVIDYRPAVSSTYSSFGNNLLPVTNGVLGRLDPNPSGLPMGGYVIRLRVINTSGRGPAPCTIHFTLSR